MKKTSSTLFTAFSKAVLKNLTKEVKETIAVDFSQPGPKKFTAADLWDIQRRKKQFVQRRFIL